MRVGREILSCPKWWYKGLRYNRLLLKVGVCHGMSIAGDSAPSCGILQCSLFVPQVLPRMSDHI